MRLVRHGSLLVALLALLLFAAPAVHAANACVSTATGNWNTPGTWTSCGGGIPTSADTVEISSDDTVTVNVSNAVAASIQVGRKVTNGGGTLFFNSGSQLTVSGVVTLGSSISGGLTTIITMTSGGVLIAANLALGSLGTPTWTPGTGSVTLTATNTLPASVFTSFYNLSLNAGTTTLGVNTAVNGTLTQSGGNIAVGSRTLTVNGIHDAGTNTVSGAGGYTLASAATLLSGSTTGINGNITTTARTLNTAANYTFNGSSAQVTGAATPATVNNLTINNSAGVTLSASIAVSSNLTVTTGTLDLGSFTANRTGAGGTLTVANLAGLKVGGTNTLPSLYSAHAIGATSTIEYSGTTQSIAVLNSAQNYGSLTISGSATKSLAGSVTVSGTLTLTAGILSIGANTLTLNGAISTSSGAITGGASSNLSIGGAGANTTLPTVTLNNLTMNRANGLTLGGNVTVGGALTFTSGNITPGANTLYISSTGSVSRTSGYVIGSFKKNVATGATSITFEVGDASNYTPVTVTFGSVTVAGDLTASVAPSDNANIGSSTINASKCVNRDWTLTNSGIAFTNYSATFTFVAGDIDAGAATSAFVVGRYSAGWTYPTVGTKTGASTQTIGLVAFGDFQIGESVAGFTISGHIQTAAAVAISGATVTLSGGQAGSATTDASGAYSFASLPAAGNYTVTPSLTNYTFNPVNRTFSNLSATQTADFTGALTPNVTLTASVNPTVTAQPGADLIYTISFSNTGAGQAQAFIISDPIPANTDFKIGSVTTTPGTTGLTVTIAYSSDNGATWTYAPASAAGGAPAGYDRNVTQIRWNFTGNLSQAGPNNTGSIGFTARIR